MMIKNKGNKEQQTILIAKPEIFSQAQELVDTVKIKKPVWHKGLRDISVGGINTYINYITNMMTVDKKVSTGIKELDEILDQLLKVNK